MKQQINWSQVWQEIRDFLKNKYIIASLIFAIVLLFVGQQSIIRDIRRAHQIREAESELAKIERDTKTATNDMEVLSITDSLERFARENHYMHADNEDVYVVKE